MTATFSVQFKDAETDQIKIWLDYLRSLDFIQAVKEKEDNKSYLSIDAIKQLYPNQWVLLADAKADGLQILGGRVILNTPNKHQLAINGRDLVKEHKQVRHFFTGERSSQKHIGLVVRQSKPI